MTNTRTIKERAPKGYQTCFEVLNAIVRHKRPSDEELKAYGIEYRNGYFPLQWAAAFDLAGGAKVDDLTQVDGLKMMKAVVELSESLECGERVGSVVGPKFQMIDMPPSAFSAGGTEELLLRGRAFVRGIETEIFIRDDSHVEGQMPEEEKMPEFGNDQPIDAKKPGRPNTSQAAALVYWGMFQNGHGQVFPNGQAGKAMQWPQAMHLVNEQLQRLGFKTVGRTVFQQAVREIGPVDPVSGKEK